jgi:hypothetical protein
MSLDNWIMSKPKEDRHLIAKTISEIQDVFKDLEQKKYLRTTLRSEERKHFPEILRTFDGLSHAFSMLFNIPFNNETFVRGRSREFVEHNKKYGFNENGYVNLLLSESLSEFLRNAELFRCCFLFVLETDKCREEKRERCPFFKTMTLGRLLDQLESVCESKGKKVRDMIDVNLRNALTHGLVWLEGCHLHYSKDITFSKEARDKIRLDRLWEKASYQDKVTQCLIQTIADWYHLTE